MTINAKSPVTSSVVRNFHNKRLLFLLAGDNVYVENTPSGMSHIDWFKTLDLTANTAEDKSAEYILNNFTRGYYFKDILVFYTGENFDVDESVIDSLRNCLDSLVSKLGVSGNTKVGLACIPIKNKIFKVRYTLGTVDEVRLLKDSRDLYKRIKGFIV